MPDPKIRHFDRLVLLLGLCQMAGWGTTYFLPGVLSQRFTEATGLSKPAIFAGITVMLIVSSLLAVPFGRFIDARGARGGLMIGTVLLTSGLVLLSQSHGPVTFYAAWLLFGLGMPGGLTNGAHSALVQRRGFAARTGINYLMLFTAASQAVYWPLTVWLEAHVGWRMTCLLFAMLNLACVAIYALLLEPGAQKPPAVEDASDERPATIPEARRLAGAALLVIVFAASGFVSWGLELHLMDMLLAMGLGQTAALAIIALRAPVSIAARSIDLVTGQRFSSLDLAFAAAGVIALSLIVALFARGSVLATLFMVLFGFGTGIMTVARATLPLTLFGPKGFATLVGRITLPTHVIYAIAPPIFGWLTTTLGSTTALGVAIASMVLAMLALLRLRDMVPRR